MIYIDIESGELFLKRHLSTHSEPISCAVRGRILYMTYQNDSGRAADGGILNYSIMPGQLSLVSRLAYHGHTFKQVCVQPETHHVFAVGLSHPEVACGLMETKNPLKMKELKHLLSRRVTEQQVSEPVFVGVTSDQKRMYCVDRGTDEILFYTYDPQGTLKKDEEHLLCFETGSGVSRMLFSPDGQYAYVLLSKLSLIKVYRYHDLSFEWIQDVSTIPDDFEGENVACSMHVDDHGFVFVTNDGHASVAFLKIQEDGTLLKKDHTSCGEGPCDLTIVDHHYVVVVCQKQGRLEVMSLDEENQRLTPLRTGYPIYSPISIAHSDIITR